MRTGPSKSSRIATSRVRRPRPPCHPDGPEIVRWFGEHSQEQLAGSAYPICCRAPKPSSSVWSTSPASLTERTRSVSGFDRAAWGLDTPQRSRGPLPNSHSTICGTCVWQRGVHPRLTKGGVSAHRQNSSAVAIKRRSNHRMSIICSRDHESTEPDEVSLWPESAGYLRSTRGCVSIA
jgi:hypothetical protein